jgi:hypothetical protein
MYWSVHGFGERESCQRGPTLQVGTVAVSADIAIVAAVTFARHTSVPSNDHNEGTDERGWGLRRSFRVSDRVGQVIGNQRI